MPFNPMLNAKLYRKNLWGFFVNKTFDLPENLMPLETGHDELVLVLNKTLSREQTVKLKLKTCIFSFNHMFKIFKFFI